MNSRLLEILRFKMKSSRSLHDLSFYKVYIIDNFLLSLVQLCSSLYIILQNLIYKIPIKYSNTCDNI